MLKTGRRGGRPYGFIGIAAMQMVFLGRGSVPALGRQTTAAEIMLQSRAGLRAGRASMVCRRSCLTAALMAYDGDSNFKNRKPKKDIFQEVYQAQFDTGIYIDVWRSRGADMWEVN